MGSLFVSFLLLSSALHRSAAIGGCRKPQVNLLSNAKDDQKYQDDKAACRSNIPGRGRRIKIVSCDQPAHVCNSLGYKYQVDEAYVGNARFNRNQHTTVFVGGTAVQVCLFGRMNTTALRSFPPRIQNSVHGQIKHALDALFNPAVDFCDIDTDTCTNASPKCSVLENYARTAAVQNFCTCSTLKVPPIPINVVFQVDVTWKILEAGGNRVDQCEKEFDAETLYKRANEPKATLACIKVPSKVLPTLKRNRGRN